MSKIINFASVGEYNDFLKERTNGKVIGRGTEGECILSSDGKSVYKKIISCNDGNYPRLRRVNYDVERIITTDDIELDYYVFPDELYTLENKLIGYKNRYIEGNDLLNLNELKNKIHMIDWDKFLNAYYEILNETDILSEKMINTVDLIGNIMFIKNHLYGIDTCSYEVVNMCMFNENRSRLFRGIKEILEGYLSNCDNVSGQIRFELFIESDIERYVKKLRKIIAK